MRPPTLSRPFFPLGDGEDSCHQPEGLRVTDEQLWPVPSLDTGPNPVPRCDAVFVERAEAVVPGVIPDPVAVVEICRRLDGIPLAIELAASRMVSMTVTEVRDRLNDRFRLLVGSRRGLERHQTLRQRSSGPTTCSIRTSRRCSTGARSSRAASTWRARVRWPAPRMSSPRWTCSTPLSASRFSLPTGRRGEPDSRCWRPSGSSPKISSPQTDWLRRHAMPTRDYFAGLRSRVVALWDSPRQREAYDWFTSELANLRTAFRWAADRGDIDTAATIVQYAFIGALVEQYEPPHGPRNSSNRRSGRTSAARSAIVVACSAVMIGRIESAVRLQRDGSAPHR